MKTKLTEEPKKKRGSSYWGAGLSSILIALIILMLACFAALTYVSANSESKLSEKSRDYCDRYYAAETTACDILSWVFQENLQISQDKSEQITYNDSTLGDIVISLKGDNVSFSVPVTQQQQLSVTAAVQQGNAEILNWQIEGQQ